MVERSLPGVVRSPERAAQLARLANRLGLLVIVIPALFVSAVNLHVSYDDAFITYRYAYNLASGNGFVYNPGEWYMGITAPLYGLLLGALGWIFGLDAIPLLGPIFFANQSVLVYLGYLLAPLAWYYIYRTRAGMNLRAIGEYPAAADALGVNIYRLRYFYVLVGGMLAGLAGATISLAVSPGWFSELTTGGQGWIAVGLVIFAQWDPLRAAFGAYAFGALRRLILDVQGPKTLFGIANPFFFNPYLGFFLQMLPYAFTIMILVLGSREAARKRLGAPAALGTPYVRGERGL